MYICKNCGKAYETPDKFCRSCGGAITESPDSVYSFQGNSAQSERTENVSGASKASGIFGMIIGIFSFIASLVTSGAVVMRFVEFINNYSYYDYYGYSSMYLEADLTNFQKWLVGALIGGVIGVTLSSIARNHGYICGQSSTGKVLSVFSLVISTIMLVITAVLCYFLNQVI